MPVAEGPSAAVLSAETNVHLRLKEARESDRFGSAPVEGELAAGHLLSTSEELLERRMRLKALGGDALRVEERSDGSLA